MAKKEVATKASTKKAPAKKAPAENAPAKKVLAKNEPAKGRESLDATKRVNMPIRMFQLDPGFVYEVSVFIGDAPEATVFGKVMVPPYSSTEFWALKGAYLDQVPKKPGQYIKQKVTMVGSSGSLFNNDPAKFKTDLKSTHALFYMMSTWP